MLEEQEKLERLDAKLRRITRDLNGYIEKMPNYVKSDNIDREAQIDEYEVKFEEMNTNVEALLELSLKPERDLLLIINTTYDNMRDLSNKINPGGNVNPEYGAITHSDKTRELANVIERLLRLIKN